MQLTAALKNKVLVNYFFIHILSKLFHYSYMIPFYLFLFWTSPHVEPNKLNKAEYCFRIFCKLIFIRMYLMKYKMLQHKPFCLRKRISGIMWISEIFTLQFSSITVVSDSLWPHGLQHVRVPCPSLFSWVCSNSCPLSWCCHPTIASLSSCLQSFPASWSFPDELTLCIR